MLKSMGIKSRPFEFYVAFLVMVIGLYGVLDPNWPPLDVEPWEAMILIVEDIYLMISGLVVMASFFVRYKWLVTGIVMEMFGWLFIGAAAAMIVITSPWLPVSAFVDSDLGSSEVYIMTIWMALWAGLAGSAVARYFDMRHWHKGGRNK